MKRQEGRTVGFRAERVLVGAALLALPVALGAALLAGPLAGGGVVLGACTGILAFLWLERSLRTDAPAPRPAPLLIGSLGRMALWAAAAVVVSVFWGAQGGGGFLAGAVAVKTALLAEGVRSGGG